MTGDARVRVLVADDEAVARAGLRDLLAQHAWLHVVGEAASGPAAVEAINRLEPELVFLDIQMPGLLGTDVLRHVTREPFVVFTTAHAQHAAAAFELGAVDYLLKPFGEARLTRALERVRSAIGESGSTSALERLQEALSSGPMSRLFVRSGGSVIPVAVASVAWFEADGDYVIAHAGRSRYMLHVPLSRLEARLDPRRFARIHRTHLVNLDHVVTFRPHGKGQLEAELRDGTKLIVSRERAREIRAQGL